MSGVLEEYHGVVIAEGPTIGEVRAIALEFADEHEVFIGRTVHPGFRFILMFETWIDIDLDAFASALAEKLDTLVLTIAQVEEREFAAGIA
ncbi:hypothetical protein [Brevibacterium litoralis]|uniref:hypothetical protein n=1 Tax=Brevibacterium litoralis TaxID=3138935 RepID=UPI0032EADE29